MRESRLRARHFTRAVPTRGMAFSEGLKESG
jgi:hypothetical protein